MRYLPWDVVMPAVLALVSRHAAHSSGKRAVYGVPRGGAVVAGMLAARTPYFNLMETVREHQLVVDDLVDSGETLGRYLGMHCEVDALFRKPSSPPDIAPHAKLLPDDEFVEFPWERDDEHGPETNIRRVLQYLGCTNQEVLENTPGRVIRALDELTSGRKEVAAAHLKTTFEEQASNIVVCKDIDFTSLCEHHLLPFTGRAHVAYLPQLGEGVVGLSKLARVVDAFARRLQIQERLGEQIATAIHDVLRPKGVAVVIESAHACLSVRGARKPNARMVTSAMRGVFLDSGQARAEVLALMGVA